MDDLDHSMHIAEYDWTSFYEDSEECGLLQPSLACPDSSCLSDSEDTENSSSILSAGQREPQHSPAAKCNESKAAGCCMEEVQNNQRDSGEQDDLTAKAEEGSEKRADIRLDYPEGNSITEQARMRTAEHIREETNDDTTLQTEQLNVQSSDGDSAELKKEDEDLKTESDTSSVCEPGPLSCKHKQPNVNEPHTTDRALSEDVSSIPLRAEKERWFVTVNDSPARQRACATSGGKKRRKKKPCKNNHMGRTPGQDKSFQDASELEINRCDNESEGETDSEYFIQSNHTSVGYLIAEENPESAQIGVILDLWQASLMSSEEDDSPETSHIPERAIDIDKQHSNTTLKDSVESDDFEFLSTHSNESESYLSAAESVEEPEHHLKEDQQLQSSSPPTTNCYLLGLTENTDATYIEMHNTLSCNITATGGYESTNVKPTLTFPSVAQSVNKMPDDSSTCANDTHSTQLCMPSDTPGLQKHEINLQASGCSSGDQLSLPRVPDVTPPPCSVADSPETYAEAAGHARTVYAISAFWDEMEKLTINDILQLRMGRSTPSRDIQETLNVDDSPTNSSHLVETLYNSSDGGLMDTSDTADSDYFTQPDESKLDQSSCEFSNSDFEEEYWQFLGTSRNPSPDPHSKNQQRTSDSPLFAHDDEDSTGSEGRETPVPSEDFAAQCFGDQESDAFITSEPAWPRQLTKIKSVRNVQALNTEDLSLQTVLGNDESHLFLSRCPPLEENMALKANGSLGTLIPAPFLPNIGVLDKYTQISLPEVFEYLFTEDKVESDSRCFTVYDPEDISVAPEFDYSLCTFRDETSVSSLSDFQCNKEKPIPIFSCSHPTIRELTIPNPDYVFLSSHFEEEEDEISPIRAVSRSFIQGGCEASAAVPHGFHSWKNLLSVRKIRFHDKGSMWCRSSGAWVFPFEAENITIQTADSPITVVTEGSVSSAPSQLFRELEVQQRILGTVQTSRQEGIFSTLKQSDMCLVCIAFASWVLRSSDPEAADTWKAALLANVSALSAIQYLRQYVQKKNASQDNP